MLGDIGVEAVEPVLEAPEPAVLELDVFPGGGTVVPGASVVVGLVAGAGVAAGGGASCAKALGAAAASIAATALASAQRCKLFRVDMSGKAPFYKNRSRNRQRGRG